MKPIDKRFAHAPPVAENLGRKKSIQDDEDKNNETTQGEEILSTCQACKKPWDKYRGKRRCPTCGVPLLICKNCHSNDRKKVKKLDISVRCDLCIKEGKLQSFYLSHHSIGCRTKLLYFGHMHFISLLNFFLVTKVLPIKRHCDKKSKMKWHYMRKS